MKISYGITVCNEEKELKELLEFLYKHIRPLDEIVIVYDQNRVTQSILDYLEGEAVLSEGLVRFFPFDFKQNFLENKNYLNSKCKGDYIFQLDADEIPSPTLISNLPIIIQNNPVDLIITPRANVVKGLTQNHINKWGWRVNEKGYVNWPDMQKRIYKNDSNIQWKGHQVHGMVEGYKTYVTLPPKESFSILHNKTIDRQESQNERYTKIEIGEL